MTMGEYKAWLEGYSEHMKGAPTKAQWKRIQEKLEEVTPESCSCHRWHWHWNYPVTSGTITYEDPKQWTYTVANTAQTLQVGYSEDSNELVCNVAA